MTPEQEKAYKMVYWGEYPILISLNILRSELECIKEGVALWKADSETGKALLAEMTERAEKVERAFEKLWGICNDSSKMLYTLEEQQP